MLKAQSESESKVTGRRFGKNSKEVDGIRELPTLASGGLAKILGNATLGKMVAIQDAAAEFGLSVATLYGLLKKGRLKRFRRVGDKRTFLNREELTAVLGYREVKAQGRVQPGAIAPLRRS